MNDPSKIETDAPTGGESGDRAAAKGATGDAANASDKGPAKPSAPPRGRKPNPMDAHVGTRVKLRRTMMGMSQEKLGQALGVTFQQVQKYEKGTNRIGAGRMQQISDTLKVPIGYFFEDAPLPQGGGESGGAATGLADTTAQAPFEADFLASPEGIQLNRAFVRIRNPDVRRQIVALVRTIADGEGS